MRELRKFLRNIVCKIHISKSLIINYNTLYFNLFLKDFIDDLLSHCLFFFNQIIPFYFPFLNQITFSFLFIFNQITLFSSHLSFISLILVLIFILFFASFSPTHFFISFSHLTLTFRVQILYLLMSHGKKVQISGLVLWRVASSYFSPATNYRKNQVNEHVLD